AKGGRVIVGFGVGNRMRDKSMSKWTAKAGTMIFGSGSATPMRGKSATCRRLLSRILRSMTAIGSETRRRSERRLTASRRLAAHRSGRAIAKSVLISFGAHIQIGDLERIGVLTLTLVVMFACGSWNHSTPAKGLGDKSARSKISSSGMVDRMLTVENLPVHYVEEGTGPSVVMIHGNAGSVEDFELGALDLLAAEYRVVAIDRPGHGRSGRVASKA